MIEPSEANKDVSFFSDRTSFPSHYWATLHPPVTSTHSTDHEQDLNEEFERLNEIHIDTNLHDPTFLRNFSYKTMISPGARTCPSLLSEMLRPQSDSRPSSPGTTHADLLSDHGSISTHSTPPYLCTSPKQRCISFLVGEKDATNQIASKPSLTPNTSEPSLPVSKGARHISFAGTVPSTTVTRPAEIKRSSERSFSECKDDVDLSNEATPVAKRAVHFTAPPPKDGLIRVPSGSSDHRSETSISSKPKTTSIRFAGPPTPVLKSATSSRRSSVDEHHHLSGQSESRSKPSSTQTSCASSPVLGPRLFPATCKSTLDAVLRKESIAKVIDTVPEEEDEDIEEDQDQADDDEDDDDNMDSFSHVGSDDEGYVEDIESDNENIDDDIFPILRLDSGTPKESLHLDSKAFFDGGNVQSGLATPIYRTAAPSESDLPDTTDFAPGTLDEDQPACVAFNTAVKDREARRKPAKPQDIDPTFPDSGSDDDDDDDDDQLNTANLKQDRVAEHASKKAIPKSPGVKKQFWNSPPLARMVDLGRAKSLPRRYLYNKRNAAGDKPLRAMTIKQSSEQKAQHRREKKEVRHNLRRVVDHNGHEKMKLHACARKKMVAKENPCVIRPVRSI